MDVRGGDGDKQCEHEGEMGVATIMTAPPTIATSHLSWGEKGC